VGASVARLCFRLFAFKVYGMMFQARALYWTMWMASRERPAASSSTSMRTSSESNTFHTLPAAVVWCRKSNLKAKFQSVS